MKNNIPKRSVEWLPTSGYWWLVLGVTFIAYLIISNYYPVNKLAWAIVSILFSFLLGGFIHKILNTIEPLSNLASPYGDSEEEQKEWREAIHKSSHDNLSGEILGSLERTIGFIVVYWGLDYHYLAVWLAFKVASKWASWNHIVKVPESFTDESSCKSRLQEIKARRLWGTFLLNRFLIGTLGNLMIGAFLAKIVL